LSLHDALPISVVRRLLLDFTNPFLNAISIMCFSISSIATGERFIPSTQADSQGAGQILPVNSGKLLVEVKIRYASSQFPSYTASLNSGMTLPSGQPE